MQFLISRYDTKSKQFEIVGGEAHHIARVLRKKTGDTLRLFDGKGKILWGEIKEASSERIAGRLLESPSHAPSLPRSIAPTLSIHLYQALPKGPKWDWVLEKGCEVGVSSFIPLLTERTVVRWNPAEPTKKLTRWRKILEASTKQCGRPKIPDIREPLTFQKSLSIIARPEGPKQSQKTISLFCWESELAEPMTAVLKNQPAPLALNIFIGPEGGWTIKEAEAAKAAGLLPVSLGSYILRAETAPIVAVSMARALLDTP